LHQIHICCHNVKLVKIIQKREGKLSLKFQKMREGRDPRDSLFPLFFITELKANEKISLPR
jgi:hypothetical protein